MQNMLEKIYIASCTTSTFHFVIFFINSAHVEMCCSCCNVLNHYFSGKVTTSGFTVASHKSLHFIYFKSKTITNGLN